MCARVVRSFAFAGLALTSPTLVYSQTITFDNRSGEPASVRVIGPSKPTADVPDGQRRTVKVGGGHYNILVRYGAGPNYRYSRGDPFMVTQTATQYSIITITLHPVVNGNYETHPSSADEYNR